MNNTENDQFDEAIPDIAYTIACEVATDWGLWLYDTETRLRVWTAITQWSARQAHLAAEQLLNQPKPRF